MEMKCEDFVEKYKNVKFRGKGDTTKTFMFTGEVNGKFCLYICYYDQGQEIHKGGVRCDYLMDEDCYTFLDFPTTNPTNQNIIEECKCSSRDLFNCGCKCGAFQMEQERG